MDITLNFEGGGGPRSLRLELDPARPAESHVLACLSHGQFYEPDVAGALRRMLRPGDAMIDVGANVGFFTLLAATIVGPTGHVASFEPDGDNIACIARNIVANGFENVSIIDSPATDRAGEVAFFINSDSSGGNALWDPAEFPGNTLSLANPQRRLVQATTLDEECHRRNLAIPRAIKIDTEGADQRVLEGAREMLRGAKVPFVICELHEFGLAKLGCSQASLRGYMEGFGYSTFLLSRDDRLPKLIPPATVLRSQIFVNLLFTRPYLLSECWPEEIVTAGVITSFE